MEIQGKLFITICANRSGILASPTHVRNKYVDLVRIPSLSRISWPSQDFDTKLA